MNPTPIGKLLHFVTAQAGVNPVIGQGAGASVQIKDGWSGSEAEFDFGRFVTL